MQRSLAIAGTACLSGIIIGKKWAREENINPLNSTFARELMPLTVQQSIYKLGQSYIKFLGINTVDFQEIRINLQLRRLFFEIITCSPLTRG